MARSRKLFRRGCGSCESPRGRTGQVDGSWPPNASSIAITSNANGEGLFRLACEQDLQGIVAKRNSDPYLHGHASRLKIRRQSYRQWGRTRGTIRAPGSGPDFQVWMDALWTVKAPPDQLAQILGRRSKYSSSSFFPPSPAPNCFSDSMNSMRSIHFTIL